MDNGRMIELPIHSPIEELHEPVFTQKQVRVFIKREDLIHPYISGNKWRKLKYNLLLAQQTGKSHLVTFGGAWSNHLLATACAAAKFGFKSTGFVRGEKVNNLALTLCNIFGMELIFVPRETYRDKEAVYKEHFQDTSNTYFINEGGSGPEAVKGCAEMIDELPDYYDHIICACGTGTTAAGIAYGIAIKMLNTRLHAVPILKDTGFIMEEIEQYNHLPVNVTIQSNYHMGGYGKTSAALISFIKSFASRTGILLDPVYTGKAAYALYDLIKNDHFSPGEKILFIHTGGLTGIAGMLDKFDKI